MNRVYLLYVSSLVDFDVNNFTVSINKISRDVYVIIRTCTFSSFVYVTFSFLFVLFLWSKLLNT